MCPEPGDLAGEGTGALAAQFDSDPSVVLGGTDRHVRPDNPSQDLGDVGIRRGSHPQLRAALINFTGDLAGDGMDTALARTRRRRERAAGRMRAGGSSQPGFVQITRTFCASSPFLPGATSNSTRWPSSRLL